MTFNGFTMLKLMHRVDGSACFVLRRTHRWGSTRFRYYIVSRRANHRCCSFGLVNFTLVEATNALERRIACWQLRVLCGSQSLMFGHVAVADQNASDLQLHVSFLIMQASQESSVRRTSSRIVLLDGCVTVEGMVMCNIMTDKPIRGRLRIESAD